MSETLRDLVVSLSLQTDNFTRNMQSVNKQIKEAESSFKLASAGVDKFDQDASVLGSQLSSLQSKLSLQKTAVDQYTKALDAARNKLQECYTRQTDYAKRLEDARVQHDALRDQVNRTEAQYKSYVQTLGDSDSATIAAKANLDALKAEYSESATELRKLAGQQTALTKATQNAADAVTTANVRLNTAKGSVKETETAIEKCNASLSLSQTNWYSAGDAIRNANTEITSIGKQIRLAESEFRLATVGMLDMEQNVSGLTAQLTMLQDKLALQQAAVQQYEAALAGAKEQLTAAQQVNDPGRIRQATDAVTDAQTALNNAKSAVKETEGAISECNASLSLAQTGWFSAGEAIQRANAEIVSIGKQMRLAESKFHVATAGVKDMDQNVDALKARLTLLQEKLALQNTALSQYSAALSAAREQLAAAQAVNDPEKIRQATDAVTDAEAALNNASASMIETVGTIGDCNASLALAQTNWYSAGETIRQSENEIASIGQQMQVHLNEVYEDPTSALSDPDATFWQDGVEVPASAVMEEQLRPDTVAILDGDGTMHILITPEVTGTKEALEETEKAMNSVEHQGSIGAKLFGDTTLDDISRLNEYLTGINNEMNSWLNFGGWMNSWDRKAASDTLSNYLDMEEIGNLQSYVAEAVAAINAGEPLSEDTLANLQSILNLVNLLDSIGIGENVTAGIAEGMTEAGFETDAETVASNLESAINSALIINSPSGRMKPVGEYVSAGIGAGAGEYDFSGDASSVASSLESALRASLPEGIFTDLGTTAMSGLAVSMAGYSMSAAGSSVSANTKSSVSASLNASTLRPVGVNAMQGLVAGINAGRSGVISAMRSAARAAVDAAKSELQIHSPSKVFENEVGIMTMKGMGKGVTEEAKRQARVMANATRYLTGEAREGAIGLTQTDNRKTYNQTSSVNLSGNNFYIRDETDIRSLAVEIATLTKRQQHGKGMRVSLA